MVGTAHGVGLSAFLGSHVHLGVVAHLQHIVRCQILVGLVVRWLFTFPWEKGSIVAVVVINFQESSHKAGTWDCCSFIFSFLTANFSTGLNSGEIRNPLAKEGSLWRHEEDFVMD